MAEKPTYMEEVDSEKELTEEDREKESTENEDKVKAASRDWKAKTQIGKKADYCKKKLK